MEIGTSGVIFLVEEHPVKFGIDRDLPYVKTQSN